MSKKKDNDTGAAISEPGIPPLSAEPVPSSPEAALVSPAPIPIPAEPTPAPPEPMPLDEVDNAIAEVQAQPGYVQRSAEHLEVLAVRKLQELGWALRRAEVAVRSRLF